jgi:hypothetical protein
MNNNFKFFQKGTVDMIDGETHITASFNDDTPEGHMNRRALYHTDRNQYDRLRHPNNEMERYFIERGFRNNLTEQRDLINTDNQRGFFQPITVTKVKETFWDKFKIVMKESWRINPIGVVVVSILSTIVTIIGIAKILSIW